MDCNFRLDNYSIGLTKTDESCLVQATELSTGMQFRKVIDDSLAKTFSDDKSLDTNTIFQLLRDYFETKPEKVSLTINNYGEIVYSCQINFGNFKKQFCFQIPLEQRGSRLTPQNELVDQLLSRISILEKQQKESCQEMVKKQDVADYVRKTNERISKLEELLQKKDRELDGLTQKYNKISLEDAKEEEETDVSSESEGAYPSEVHYYKGKFHHNQNFESTFKFRLLENNRSAFSTTASAGCIFASKPLPKSTRSRFTFKVFDKDMTWLIVGIAPWSAFGDKCCWKHDDTIGFSNDGRVCDGGTLQRVGLESIINESCVTFEVDAINDVVLLFSDNKYLHTFQITCEEEYYPFLYTSRTIGIGVTFV